MERSIRIVHVTDLHLMADADATFFGTRTAETAERVFGAIREMAPAPDLVVATGDLASDGDPESYRRLRTLTDSLPCPARCALGNHDVRRSFRAAWEGQSMPDDAPLSYAFDFVGLQVILLDTSVPGEEGGHLGPDQIAWLEKELAAAAALPKVIFLHHHPVEIGSPWMDRMMLSNPDDLFRTLGPAKETMLGIFFGHVHHDFETKWEGVPLFGTRPTSLTFTPRTEQFVPSEEPPGYRIIDIRDGRLATRTVPVPP